MRLEPLVELAAKMVREKGRMEECARMDFAFLLDVSCGKQSCSLC